MAEWQFDYVRTVDYLRVACPRQQPVQQQVLNIFQSITPPDCQFRPTRIWSRETRKKKAPCLWCVLYTAQNNEIRCLPGNQAKELRRELSNFTPPNASIIEHEFYQDDALIDHGLTMVWKVWCEHVPKVHKLDKTREEQLPIGQMGRIL